LHGFALAIENSFDVLTIHLILGAPDIFKGDATNLIPAIRRSAHHQKSVHLFEA
jgi:hypothetical protein